MWNAEQSEAARLNGWDVFDVFDGRRWLAMPLYVGDAKDQRALMHHLIANAKLGDRLSTAALRHISQMNRK